MSWKEAVIKLKMPRFVISHRIDVARKKQFARELYRLDCVQFYLNVPRFIWTWYIRLSDTTAQWGPS
ncbi:MAG: hypothetical protein CME31_22800 [Gimesia sp.]|nr:hypothetical protein [Gimesia sp.]